MKITPRRDFKLLGTSIHLTAGKAYDAIHATNIPWCREYKKIFVTDAENDSTGLGFLLVAGDYDIVEE